MFPALHPSDLPLKWTVYLETRKARKDAIFYAGDDRCGSWPIIKQFLPGSMNYQYNRYGGLPKHGERIPASNQE